MKYLHLYILLMGVAVCCSCHKDQDITPIAGDCTELNYLPSLDGPKFEYTTKWFPRTAYYTHNSEQIVVAMTSRKNTAEMDIHVYDRSKKKSCCIVKDVDNISNIGASNKIVFLRDRQLWETDLKGKDPKLILNKFGTSLQWNPAGTILGFYELQKNFWWDGKEVRQVYADFPSLGISQPMKWDCSGTKLVFYHHDTEPKLVLYDTLSNTFSEIAWSYNKEVSFNIVWNEAQNCEELIWQNHVGLQATNLLTSETRMLREYCQSRRYEAFQVSATYHKLLAVRKDITPIKGKGNTFKVDQYLVEMNLDGSGERKIDL